MALHYSVGGHAMLASAYMMAELIQRFIKNGYWMLDSRYW